MFKRLIDIVFAILILAACLPLILIILFASFLLIGENPLVYQKRRITLCKKEINIIKIKTIKNNIVIRNLEDSCNQIFFKSSYEDFVPSFCKWLRKSGFDEILQLVNVLKGDMSFVGPRPLLEKDLMIIKQNSPEYYERRKKINSKPGITGCWQVYGNRAKGTANLVELDEKYERLKSAVFDLKIIMKTIIIFFTASHSDAIVTGLLNKNKRVAPNCVYDYVD
jgi:lipopolysaccharide/colanic/teichoic acid biosynthesis glycosyltransferase